MIKIKIYNPTKDRNEPTFRPFYFVKDMLEDYSIEITNSDDFDFLFIGMSDFLDKSMTLKDSIDWGLENIQKYTEDGDYFLFDGQDSHSLMASYEVFKNSGAKYLFKNQLLRNKSDYKIPKSFNKWFFGSDGRLDLSYDISDDMWDRIKLTGWNMMANVPSHKNYININKNKTIDVCAIFGSGDSSKKEYDHTVQNDDLYKQHRKDIFDVIEKLSQKYNVVYGKRPFQEYMEILYNSKICISPFGMGEIRQGDGEAVQVGTTICKEDMSMYDFGSNVWIENETYIPFDYDCSNLFENLEKALMSYDQKIVDNMRELYLKEYSDDKLCKRWYDIFNSMDSIVYE